MIGLQSEGGCDVVPPVFLDWDLMQWYAVFFNLTVESYISQIISKMQHSKVYSEYILTFI